MRLALSEPAESESKDYGFTLLEVLISLALVSLITIAIFQSFMSMSRLSDRAQAATSNIYNQYVNRILFGRVVEGIFPDRKLEGRQWFQGTELEFSGMSRGFILSDMPNKGLVSFRVIAVDERLMLNTKEVQLILAEKNNVKGFFYLGSDRVWHSNWPPERALPYGPIDKIKTQDHELASPPVLPLAIRISFANGRDWIALPLGPSRVVAADEEI